MQDIIHLLPDSVANQIAAGEVIARPASVIKELVENAVDAGADNIQIIIRDGGKSLIQVVDNGTGMSETDARLAFERHATSKITTAADLFSLHTMGFRGEALPSICAISQTELQTRLHGEQLGSRLVIHGSKVVSQEVCTCAPGSNFMVKNLFFNAPARRRFLKSDQIEQKHIMREFERMALVNPDKQMSIDTGSRTITLKPGTFLQRISGLWKNTLDKHLIPVRVDTALVKIDGYVSRPEHARKVNALQYFLVNGRNMQHPVFRKAVMRCYEGLIPNGTQPNYFLRFTVDPATIDVNVHPTKHEIKFEDESAIFQILSAAVRSALGQNAAVPSINFEEDALDVVPPAQGTFVDAPASGVDNTYNPFDTRPSGPIRISHSRAPKRVEKDWTTLYDRFTGNESNIPEPPASTPEFQGMEADKTGEVSAICIQLADKYIVTSSREGLIIIDQHRAHLVILYSRLAASIRSGEAISQRMMFEEEVTLAPRQRSALERFEKELRRMGFLLEYSEGDTWRICGAPSFVTEGNPSDFVTELLDAAADEYDSYDNAADTLRRRLYLLTARARAIKGGTTLSQSEMERIVSDLFSLPEPALTPDGHSVFTKVSLDFIASSLR